MSEIYDVVIIGSGLGGLLSGVILASEGMRVCILEKNRQVGGSLQTFVRDRCILDTGVHYIGGLGEGQSLRQYFRFAGIMDDLTIRQLDTEGFDIITLENDEVEYPQAQGYPRFIERLTELFPHEREGIRRYCQLVQEYCAKFPMYSLNASAKYPDTTEHLSTNAEAVIASVVQDERLRAVLAGNNMVYAGESAATPFYVHALAMNSYIESSWRCVDGGGQISKLLVRELRKHGGTIFKRAEVKRMISEGGKITAVELADGERIYGKRFISNIHPIATLAMLDTDLLRRSYRERINTLEDTVSTFCVHLTFDPETIPYRNYNYYHLRQPNAWNTTRHSDANWPLHYMISMGPNAKHPDFTDNITLMSYMRYEEVARWAGTHNTTLDPQTRGEEYEAFKQRKEAIAVEEIAKKIPEIRGKIKGVYSSSPLSFRDYIGSPTGSLYGILHDHRDPLRTMVSTKTKIENLWMTGQNTNLHGILGVTVGAYLTCFELLGKDYLLHKILKA